MAKVKRKRSEQQFMPGTEPVKNPRVHKAAVRYVEERDARIAANKEEKAAHDTLLAIMREEGLESYEYGNLKIWVDGSYKVKVKGGKEEEDDTAKA